MQSQIANGTRIKVRHDLGLEIGEVIGRSHGEDALRYDIRFDDGTISSWPAERIERLICERCGCSNEPGAHAAGCEDGQLRWGNIAPRDGEVEER